MSSDYTISANRNLMMEAHAATQSGCDVSIHVRGIKPIEVREIEPIEAENNFASVHCWDEAGAKQETWLLPLNTIQAVQIHENWRTT